MFLGLLYLPLTETSVIAYAAILGFLWLGTIPLTSGLIVTFFGPRWLSTLYGIVFVSHQVGGFMGAWLGGWLYDRYQSYDLLWWAAIAVSLMAAALHMPIIERAVAPACYAGARGIDGGDGMPLAARIIIIASMTLLCAGAAYLMLARGPALLIDLSAAASRVLCL